MLDALRTASTHVGLMTAQASKAFTVAASTDTFTVTAHGYSNGDLVVLTSLTNGAGLFATRPYFVVGATTNTFQVSETSGGSAVNVTTDDSGNVVKLTELSGGSPAYARKAITYAAAANRLVDDTTNGVTFDVPAGSTVNYVSRHSASTAGTLHMIDAVTAETFGAQGTYTVSDAKFDLNAAA